MLQTPAVQQTVAKMLMQASCDVSVEGCEQVANSELVRPGEEDFVSLTLGLYAEAGLMFLASLIPLFTYPGALEDESSSETGYEAEIL